MTQKAGVFVKAIQKFADSKKDTSLLHYVIHYSLFMT